MIRRAFWRLLLEQGGWSRIWYGLATAMVIAGGGLIYNQTRPPSGGDCALPNYPDSSCTGYPSGQSFTTSGGITISTDNATYDGYHFTGGVFVDATGVTIKNSWIEGGGSDAIEVANGASLTVQDTNLDCESAAAAQGIFMNYDTGNVTVDRVDIYGGCADGIYFTKNLTFRDSYIHGMLQQGESHNDGIQNDGGGNALIQHNTIDGTDTSAINYCNSAACPTLSNVTITQNFLECTTFCSYDLYCPIPNTTNFYITDNAFWDDSSHFGSSTSCTGGHITDTSGNFKYPSGTPYALQ